MIHITDRADCCGCTACAAVCPHGAVSMRADAMGFRYPAVNADLCVECGLCERVCPFNNGYDKSRNIAPTSYAVRHKDINEVTSSRSGAAFIALSDRILEEGGSVYGAGWSGHFTVTHKRAASRQERDGFKGSKYVQSDMDGIIRQVREDLGKGLSVMFSGTPCQVAGVKSAIGKQLAGHLVTVDIICHGVPSPAVWKDYLGWLEERRGSEIISVDFRDKRTFGWKAHRETYRFADGGTMHCKTFTALFYKHIMLRPSCGRCPFANMERPSDLTLGDFWGWEKAAPDMNKDDKGLSLLICNTEKGRALLERAMSDLHCKAVDIKDCLQPNLLHPSSISKDAPAFEKDYKAGGFRHILPIYMPEHGLRRLLQQLKQLIK